MGGKGRARGRGKVRRRKGERREEHEGTKEHIVRDNLNKHVLVVSDVVVHDWLVAIAAATATGLVGGSGGALGGHLGNLGLKPRPHSEITGIDLLTHL